MPRTQTRPTETTPQPVVKASQPHWGLVVLGSVVLVLFIAGVAINRSVGSKTAEHKSGANTTTTTKTLLSDTLLTALLSTGATLLLVGFLYSRITTIKLPGGAEVDLSALTGDEKKLMQRALTQHVQHGKIPATEVPRVTLSAYENILTQKRERFASEAIPDLELSGSQIRSAVDQAVARET